MRLRLGGLSLYKYKPFWNLYSYRYPNTSVFFALPLPFPLPLPLPSPLPSLPLTLTLTLILTLGLTLTRTLVLAAPIHECCTESPKQPERYEDMTEFSWFQKPCWQNWYHRTWFVWSLGTQSRNVSYHHKVGLL